MYRCAGRARGRPRRARALERPLARIRAEELLDGEAAGADEIEHGAGVRPVARLDDDVEADPPERGVRAEALDAHVEDVDALRRQHAGERVQPAGLVVEPGAERGVAARAGEALLQHLSQEVWIDVPAGDDDTDARAEGGRMLQRGGERGRAGALRQQLVPLQ